MAKQRKKNVLFDNREKPIHALDEACEVYFNAVQERLPLTKAEKDAKDSLINLMVKHGKHLYKTADGKEVSLTDSHNVKVKAVGGGEEDGDGEE